MLDFSLKCQTKQEEKIRIHSLSPWKAGKTVRDLFDIYAFTLVHQIEGQENGFTRDIYHIIHSA